MIEQIRVCLVSRVSTLDTSQDSSLTFQNDVLTDFILKQPNEIFNPDTDIFSDRITGTKIERKNSDFERLMKLLGFEIIDNSKGDTIELSIKTNKKINPYYKKIYTKSTSRFSRASFKGESLLDILKKRGIEVYFYDLQKGTFTLTDEEIKIYSLIDSNYSKKMSYNWKTSNIYKTTNRKALLRGKFYGYDNVKINGEKYYKINNEEYKVIREIVDLFLNKDFGCDLISQKVGLEKSHINRMLKNRHYLGQEKYYDYPKDYQNTFDSDNNREYLKNLNFHWSECNYIDQIITEEEFNLIQEKLQSRTKNARGFRNPYLDISKKLICGCCKSNFFSQGSKNTSNDRRFKCSSLRHKKKVDVERCPSAAFYDEYLNDFLEKKAESFKSRQMKIYKDNLNNLLYLRVHLANILLKDNDNYFNNLIEEKEELEERLEESLRTSLTSKSSKKVMEKLIKEIDEQLEIIDSKIKIYLDLKNNISSIITEINTLYLKIQEDYLKLMDREKYTKNEMLEEIKEIIVLPKPKDKVYKKNSVYFFIHTFLEIEIFDLINEIYNSEIKNVLEQNIIRPSNNKFEKHFIVRIPTDEQINKSIDLLHDLDLL